MEPSSTRRAGTRQNATGSRADPGTGFPHVTPETLLDYSVLNLIGRATRAGVALIRTRIIEPHRRRARLKAAVRDLRGMSDYHLKDIGLTRAEICAAVYSGHERPSPARKTPARKTPRQPLPPKRRSRKPRRRNPAPAVVTTPRPARRRA